MQISIQSRYLHYSSDTRLPVTSFSHSPIDLHFFMLQFFSSECKNVPLSNRRRTRTCLFISCSLLSPLSLLLQYLCVCVCVCRSERTSNTTSLTAKPAHLGHTRLIHTHHMPFIISHINKTINIKERYDENNLQPLTYMWPVTAKATIPVIKQLWEPRRARQGQTLKHFRLQVKICCQIKTARLILTVSSYFRC